MRSSLLSTLAVAACLPAAAFAQTTFSWTGDTDGNWSAAANWNPSTGAPPGTTATDIARFNADVTNKAVALGTATTINRLEFLSGAGSYTLSGQALTLGTDGGIAVSNSSGLLQTISSQVNFTGANANISAASGSTLTFSSTIARASGTSGSLIVSGGGLVNFTGNFASFTLFQNLSVSAGTTVNYNTTSANGFNNYIANGGRININRLTGTTGISLRLSGDGGEIYITEVMNLGTNSLNFRGDGANGKTLTFGANITGTGNAGYSGTVNLNNTSAGTNQTYRLFAAANNTLALSGTIVDSNVSGAGTKVEIAGAGVVRYSGTSANTSVTPIVIAAGATLELAKTAGVNAIAGGSVTIGADGLLRLAASNQIADATALSFEGGAFRAAAFSDTLGALTVGATGGTIDFAGEAGSLTFASLSSITGTLTVTGWSEGASLFFTDGSGWDASALSKVVFVGHGAAAFDELTGSLYAGAIPEPSSAVALAAFGALASAGMRRRRVRI